MEELVLEQRVRPVTVGAQRLHELRKPQVQPLEVIGPAFGNLLVHVMAGSATDIADPRLTSMLVEGVQMVKRHTRPNPQKNVKGGILEKEAPIHLSCVMPVDPETKKPTRVGGRVLEDGSRVRVAVRSGAILDK